MFAPDDFKFDPYGHWTNQASHALQVGMLIMLWGGAVTYLLIMGEFPEKVPFGLAALAVYFAYEIVAQGWRRLDTINDTTFVVGWGVWAPLAVFSGAGPNSPIITANVYEMAPYIGGFFAHLCYGAWVRWRRAKLTGSL